MSALTEAETQAIAAALYRGIERTQWDEGDRHPILAAVEQILAAREATLLDRLGRLADDWESRFNAWHRECACHIPLRAEFLRQGGEE